jgi:hypothetical protein
MVNKTLPEMRSGFLTLLRDKMQPETPLATGCVANNGGALMQMKGTTLVTGLIVSVILAAATVSANEKDYAPPICPHILGWPDDVKEWAEGAPWIKALDITSVGMAKQKGKRVFYRVFDHASGPDGLTSIGGKAFGDEILERLSHLSKEDWPEAIGFLNEFGTASKEQTDCFIGMYDRLREGGYKGMIVYGSYGPGGPPMDEWAKPHVKEAVLKADAIETHEYWDLTVKHLNTWLAHRHVRIIEKYPYLKNKPWFIGEFGSDGVVQNEDPERRSGWRQRAYRGPGKEGPQKMTADEYIKQLEIYRYGDKDEEVVAPADNVLAVFLFQQGAAPPMWEGWETRGTKVMDYMKATWKPTHGFITGSILDSDKKPVKGATVTLSGSKKKVVTDVKGVYWFFALRPGEYTVRVAKPGMADVSKKTSVKADEIKTVDVVLKPAADK